MRSTPQIAEQLQLHTVLGISNRIKLLVTRFVIHQPRTAPSPRPGPPADTEHSSPRGKNAPSPNWVPARLYCTYQGESLRSPRWPFPGARAIKSKRSIRPCTELVPFAQVHFPAPGTLRAARNSSSTAAGSIRIAAHPATAPQRSPQTIRSASAR